VLGRVKKGEGGGNWAARTGPERGGLACAWGWARVAKDQVLPSYFFKFKTISNSVSKAFTYIF